nr:histidinol dehydrogenase [Sphingomicrobium nitratireducens]
MTARVASIADEVASGGWDALCRIARDVDGVAPVAVEVAPEARKARGTLPANAIAAIELARRNIDRFHRVAIPRTTTVETMPGVTVTKRWVPLDRVGLYVPGGRAPLFSTLLMLALPARCAGVGELVCVTPPRQGGGLDPAIAFAAELAGIERIWTVGGAQAIAAMAFGAGDIPAVDLVCGPGNAWVAAAKAMVAARPGGPALDLPAGPSELMVIADGKADPRIVAADLLSQAEHDADAQAILVSTDRAFAEAAMRQVGEQARAMGGGFAPVRALTCADLDEAALIANAYAPEHLSLALGDKSAERVAERITNAGAIFVGRAAAETLGDYLAGSSHVLPTDGAARHSGGITVHSFMKTISVQRVTDEAARELAAPAATLARLEGLEAHARAAEARAMAEPVS